jgi:dolichol kinase
MKERKAFSTEVKRQMLHLLLGIVLISVLALFGLESFRQFLGFLVVMGAFLFVLAFYKIWKPLNRLLKEVERSNERYPGEAAFFFILGIGIVSWFFSNPQIVMGAIVALTFQDAVATFVGVNVGKVKIFRKKTLEGTLAGFLTGIITLSIFFPLQTAVLVIIITTFVELLPINDALTVPITAALLLQILL